MTRWLDRLRRQFTRPGWTWRAFLLPHQTHLAASAARLGILLRWPPLLASPALVLLNPVGMPNIGALFLLGILYNAILTGAVIRDRHPSLWLTAVLDTLLISAAVFLRGGLYSNFYLLYLLPLIYLTLAFSWHGAVAGVVLSAVGYTAAAWLVHGFLGIAAGNLGGNSILLRLVYVAAVGVALSLVVIRFEQAFGALAQARTTLADRVRRLEAIERITQRLHTLTSVEAIGALIAWETHDLISYANCRVYIWRDAPDGAVLRLIGFYGALSDNLALPPSVRTVRVGEGLTGWVAAHGQAALLPDAEADPRAAHIPGTPHIPYSLLAAPLQTDERVQGVIVMGKPGARQLSAEDQHLLETLANSAAVALANAEKQRLLAEQAHTDPITGLPHQGAFQAALTEALSESPDAVGALGLALIDLDAFRAFNEHQGLAAGDSCLAAVGRLLQGMVAEATELPREGADTPGPGSLAAFRIGGDEFALLLAGALAEPEAGLALVRRAVAGIADLAPEDPLRQVTASAGLAFYPADAADWRGLVDLADAALYVVRQGGGNNVARADAAVAETLTLRRQLDTVVQTSLAGAGSEDVVAYLLQQTAALQGIAGPAATAERLTTEALRALAAAIDAKDDYTRGHSDRVAATAAEMARQMGCTHEEELRIATAARMHDIGKIGVPDELLHKGYALTQEERAAVARHPDIGADILLQIHTLADVVPIVRHHHERYDGKGYPLGLAGEAIPFGARVLAVADALDAMITDRPYRRGMPVPEALAELQRHEGTHFWPPVVAAARALYGPGGTGLALHAFSAGALTDSSGAAALRAAGLVPSDPLVIAMAPEPVVMGADGQQTGVSAPVESHLQRQPVG